MQLSVNQSRFLNQLIVKGPQRSDELARAMNISTSNVGTVGIDLRAKALVSSTNDGKAYQLWALTDRGRAMLAELSTPPAAPKPYRVLQVSDTGVTLFDREYRTESLAQNFANTNIEGLSTGNTVNYVVTLHSSVKFVPPVPAGREVVTY